MPGPRDKPEWVAARIVLSNPNVRVAVSASDSEGGVSARSLFTVTLSYRRESDNAVGEHVCVHRRAAFRKLVERIGVQDRNAGAMLALMVPPAQSLAGLGAYYSAAKEAGRLQAAINSVVADPELRELDAALAFFAATRGKRALASPRGKRTYGDRSRQFAGIRSPVGSYLRGASGAPEAKMNVAMRWAAPQVVAAPQQLEVLFDFTGENEGELTLKVGERVEATERGGGAEQEGWTSVSVLGAGGKRTGFVPSSYVQLTAATPGRQVPKMPSLLEMSATPKSSQMQGMSLRAGTFHESFISRISTPSKVPAPSPRRMPAKAPSSPKWTKKELRVKYASGESFRMSDPYRARDSATRGRAEVVHISHVDERSKPVMPDM